MNKRFRLLLVLLFVVIAGVFLSPTVRWFFIVPEEKKELAQSSSIQIRNYARDEASEAMKTLVGRVKDNPDGELPGEYSFLRKAAEKNYKLVDRDLPGQWTVGTVLDGFKDKEELFETLTDHYRMEVEDLKDMRNRSLQLGLDLSGGLSVVLEADRESLEERLGHAPSEEDLNSAVKRAMEILNNRIDRFGVTEPEISRQGSGQILVELPGAPDPDRVNSFLMGKGSLNFHIVDQEATNKVNRLVRENPAIGMNEYEIPELPEDFISQDLVVRGYYKKDKYGVEQAPVTYVVIKKEPGLDGKHIKDAQVNRDPVTGRPLVNFQLTGEGGEIFYRLTSANQGKNMAVVMDDKVKAWATIQEPIRNSVQISGFDEAEARNLALILRTAAMPVDLNIANLQEVGASLGKDMVEAGLNSIYLGFALVIIFMLLWYKGAGFYADVALVTNLFLVFSILSAFNLTLTLTSIAGIILTVGMAVDANVIIFERIKEEYLVGKSRQAAVAGGFKKAFWTIMDANVTTFIAALFLSQLGKGPVQGFAVTLAVGIVCSIFTALFLSRLLFDFTTDVLKRHKISIAWRLQA